MKKCCYVLKPASKDTVAIYCEKKISKYKIVRDDDGNKRRVYSSFCEEHDSPEDEEDIFG